jgi:hypothetical protein
MRRARKERNWREDFRKVSRSSGVSSRQQTASFGGPANPSPQDVQTRLNALGANPKLVVDGNFGTASRAALTAFQRSRNLKPDGIAGPQTLAALGFAGATGIGSAPDTSVFTNITSGISSAISGLKQSVIDAFPTFSAKFETFTPYMYTDIKGLVTTGIGNLIDDSKKGAPATSPPASAMSLGWKRPDGSPASPDEIIAAWQTVKRAWPGVQSTGSQRLTNIRLDKDAVAKLVTSKLDANHQYLVGQYPRYPSWPADAQLALHSISWAWGPGFARVWGSHGDDFRAAANQSKPDFISAATAMKNASAQEESINAGIIPRNAANVQLFQNAADVLDKGANPDLLYWPSNNVLKVVGIGLGGIVTLIALGFGGLALYERYHT